MTSRAPSPAPDADALLPWLQQQRWYAGRGRDVRHLTELAAWQLGGEGELGLVDVLLQCAYADGGADVYQLLLSRRPTADPERESALVAAVDGSCWYDAPHDPAAMALLARLLDEGGTAGEVQLHGEGLASDLPSTVLGVEQSNTSVVFGESVILKLYRRLQPGLNPDLEVARALSGADHVAPALAWVEAPLDGVPTTLAMGQPFFASASEGWQLALASVRDLFAEADLHAHEVGGDFAAESERFGAATASVHRSLAAAFPTGAFGSAEVAELMDLLHTRLARAIDAAPELHDHAPAIAAAYAEAEQAARGLPRQRVHGDLHLGQVLRVDTGWLLLDFEGEPLRSMAERTSLDSPLRDVAGVLRSLDYAAQTLLLDSHGAGPQLERRSLEWVERNTNAYCRGYASVSGRDPREDEALLRAYVLDKAVYEVAYEASHRPAWLDIPVRAVARLLAEKVL